MSTNALAIYKPEELARYAFLDPARDIVAGLKAAVGPRLSITDLVKITIDNNGKLHIPTLGGDQLVDSVEGVVVLNHLWRGFYPKKYNKKEAGAIPQCTSTDGVHGVGDPGTWCETCPLNMWGSAGQVFGDGGRGKACKEFWHMYIWRAGKKRPELLQVPSTSIGVIRQYMMGLLDLEELESLAINVDGQATPMPLLGVVTRFTCQEIKGQWKIVPTVAGFLPDVVWPHSLKAADAIAGMIAVQARASVGTQPTTVEASPARGVDFSKLRQAQQAGRVPPMDTEEHQGLAQPGAARARRNPTEPVPMALVFTAEELEAADAANDGLADIDL